MKYIFTLAVMALSVLVLRAGEPVVKVELQTPPPGLKGIITVGDVAVVTGGTPLQRQKILKLDLAELTGKEPQTTITRRQVEFRLRLADFAEEQFRVAGEKEISLALEKRPLLESDIIQVAETELRKSLRGSEQMSIMLAQNILVALPKVEYADEITIAAAPHATPKPGRCQMNVTLSGGGIRQTTFPVYFEVKGDDAPASMTFPRLEPLPRASIGAVLIQPKQRVNIVVKNGPITISSFGEAQEGGRMGQTIKVQNTDSKKIISARVTGANTVEIELGGNQ